MSDSFVLSKEKATTGGVGGAAASLDEEGAAGVETAVVAGMWMEVGGTAVVVEGSCFGCCSGGTSDADDEAGGG